MIWHALRFDRLADRFAIALVCIVFAINGPSALGQEPDAISWRDDYGNALEEAHSAGRMLWIQFTGPWCPNCTRMERETFPAAAVVRYAQGSFVALKLRSDIHEELALQFNLSGLPATVVVAPSREIVAVHQGYLGPVELDAFLRDALNRQSGRAPDEDKGSTKTEEFAAAAADRARPKDALPLALSGYCAVSLICDRKLVVGLAEHAVEHEGRVYRLASSALQERFRADPARYAPANDGSCPVNRLDRGTMQPGNPRWGLIYRSRLFVCATEEDRRRFLADPDRYVGVDVADRGFCPHCIRESGLLVRGDPRHELARQGQRYWFPDLVHREAFLTSLR
jgi:YHS domain-containing protein